MFRHLFGPGVPEVTPDEARRRAAEGAVIVDVREPDEWRAGHIPGARHIPLGRLAAAVQELDPDREVIVVCRSGSRSAVAARALLRAGFPRVSNLAGGMIAWTGRGLPVKR